MNSKKLLRDNTDDCNVWDLLNNAELEGSLFSLPLRSENCWLENRFIYIVGNQQDRCIYF